MAIACHLRAQPNRIAAVVVTLVLVFGLARFVAPGAPRLPECPAAGASGAAPPLLAPRVYTSSEHFCAQLTAPVTSGSGSFIRVAVDADPTFYLVPAVPDHLHLTPYAARGEAAPDIVDYQIFADVFRGAPSDAVFLDIGANVGLASLRVAALGYRIVAVEAAPANVRALALSVCVNPSFADRFTLVGAAAGATDASVTLYVPTERGDNAALSRIGSTANLETKEAARETIALARIDTLFTSLNLGALIPRIRLVKIDVQGFETGVLTGATGLLAQLSVGAWVVAEHDPKLIALSCAGGSSTSDIELMEARGFSVHKSWKGPVWTAWRNIPFSADVWYRKL